MIAVSSENHQRFIKLDRSRQDESRSEIIGRRFLAPTGFTAAEIQASQSTIHNPHSEIRIVFSPITLIPCRSVPISKKEKTSPKT